MKINQIVERKPEPFLVEFSENSYLFQIYITFLIKSAFYELINQTVPKNLNDSSILYELSYHL